MSLRRLISAAAQAALLFAGLTNAHAHVHLCFDGSEPPATLHWATGETLAQSHADDHDFPHHHGAPDAAAAHDASGNEASGHDDVDVEVTTSAIAKAAKHHAFAALPPSLLLALAPPRAAHVAAAPDDAPRTPSARTRPQPRAPPAV